jgi:hypothetical protein
MIENTVYEKLLNMTDAEAADILERWFFSMYSKKVRRGDNIPLLQSIHLVAVTKAINRLRGIK